VVAEVRGRLSVSKWDTQKFDMEKFNLKKPNEVEDKLRSQTCCATLENLDADENINRALETISENIKISTKESLGY
jgi:hypothetical protein